MEKYGQYRDKGSGIAPFFPISAPETRAILFPWRIFLFSMRIPVLIFSWLVWLAVIQWLPAGSALRKANQWCLLGIPGVWWTDIQVDGVRRGSLSQGPRGRLPHPGTIIACSWTSPLDILYLAAIWDPIFTLSTPSSKLVRPVSQETMLAACFCVTNPLEFGAPQEYIELDKLVKTNPRRVIVVFPEATTSNGRAILRLSPSLLSSGSNTKIFPISLRFSPTDIVTPVPGWIEALRFIWKLNTGQTHLVRVRIGGSRTLSQLFHQIHEENRPAITPRKSSYDSNYFDRFSDESLHVGEDSLTPEEHKVLGSIADDMARLGRVTRVGLGVSEKKKFVEAWQRRIKRS
ncbi:vacuolar protein sorting protein Vps66 [Piedraia hortae CBS 480.64]|uniref:Vacuolar protein sorting protein Vps66 n=1 Tax=Piedraia hortae CBS 480.64 TaxID=1314780 RepID=A0A6A7CB89_9PEZI|nr:vacuolar protein sorting protein Vps66 [Piedraia hortae CBS 480.64]